MATSRSTIEVDRTVAARAGASAGQERVSLESFVGLHAAKIVWALAVLAAFRILILAMAFPLSNQVDERYHLATIQMYAQGRLPGRELPYIDPESSRTLLLYWSPELGSSQQQMARSDVVGPLYSLSPEARQISLDRDYYRKKLEQWSRRPN